MSTANGRDSGKNVLDSVRHIERALEDRQEVQALAEKRLAAAREEAERIIAVARKEGERAADERRREVLSAADEEAASILRAARVEASRLRAWMAENREAEVEAVVGRVLPRGGV